MVEVVVDYRKGDSILISCTLSVGFLVKNENQ